MMPRTPFLLRGLSGPTSAMRLRLRMEWLVCTALAFGLAVVLRQTGAAERLDLGLYDLLLQIDSRPAHPDVVLVAIDEQSLATKGRWPWPRTHHAQLLDRLAQASPRAVAIDVMFAERSEDRASDARLARALQDLTARCAVYLPVTNNFSAFAGPSAETLHPLPELEQSVSGLGHIHVDLDRDAVLRSIYLYEGPSQSQWPALAMRLGTLDAEPLRVSRQPWPSKPDWYRSERRLIPFSGPAGYYKAVSASALMDGRIAQDELRDKLVVVGLTATGIGGQFPTPFSAARGLVSGTEINATVVDALLTNRLLTVAPPIVQWMLGGSILLGWMIVLKRLRPRVGLACLLVVVGVLIVVSGALHIFARVSWAPSAWSVSALAGYVLWHWRRLTVLMTQLHQRAKRLGATTPQGASPSGYGWDEIVTAFDTVVDVQRQRKDILQLLSHDLRAPQSAILALLRIDKHRSGVESDLHQSIAKQVDKTLTLAEGLVNHIRADSFGYRREDVEVLQLVNQVRERALPLAQERNVTLSVTCAADDSKQIVEDEGFWIFADPSLMERVFFNLVDNSIKYGRQGGFCRIEVRWTGSRPSRRVAVAITDEGQGIAPDDIPHIFNRYHRLGTGKDKRQISGHGLGLVFVERVVKRHNGVVRCESRAGEGSAFIVELPEAVDAQPMIEKVLAPEY